jgi:cytochrome P450
MNSLEDFSLTNPKTLAWPFDFYDAMRREDPVHFDASAGLYVVSRFEDVQTALRQPHLFSTEEGFKAQFTYDFSDEVDALMHKEGFGPIPDVILTDPPKHTRIRKLTEKAFTAHRVATMEPHITDLTVKLIEGFADRGQADAMKEFAVQLPLQVIAEQLGVEDGDLGDFQRWSKAAVSRLSRLMTREMALGYARDMCEMHRYLKARIDERQANRREDMISDLVHARIEDDENPRLSVIEVLSMSVALLAAGNETTTTGIGNLILLLSTRPDILKTLRESPDQDRTLTRFTEELLRLESPVRGLPRMTTAETELGGVKIPKGSHLMLFFASANRDPAKFDHPSEFNLQRGNLGQHVAFGGGIHRCVGAALARMEMKVAAREIIARLGNLQLAIPMKDLDFIPSLSNRAFRSLPVTFTLRVNLEVAPEGT